MDGEIGHVEDFILDTEAWRIHYLALDTRNWLPGKKVLSGCPVVYSRHACARSAGGG
jgi:hypothetical protein